ncbi:MAG TPA: DUF6624 domain-containing protein [Pirellulales bacterium]|jgi:hypothetical protein
MNSCLIAAALLALFVEPAAKKEVDNPDLRHELLRRKDIDQQARFAVIDWLKAHHVVIDMPTVSKLELKERQEYEGLEATMKSVDAENVAWLKQLVDQQGWPKITQAGRDGAHAAWLIVQHASADRPFQRHCLDLMVDMPKDEISAPNVAYLTDRVLLAEGKKQLYGTQFTSADGRWQPLPLENEAFVDKRRAEVGLGPLADYVIEMEKTYGRPLKQ